MWAFRYKKKSIFRRIYYLFICKYNHEEWKWSFQQQQNHCLEGATLIWRKSSLVRSTSWLQPLACLLLLFRSRHYNFLSSWKDRDKIKTAIIIIIMCLNLPSCEIKNLLMFCKVRWRKYIFCNSVYSMF